MKKSATVLTIVFSCLLSVKPVIADGSIVKKWMAGTELDLVPYLFDGYYFSLVAGFGHWRARFVRTHITTPDFATYSGFDDNELDVNAYILDYYFKPEFEGWWIGPGYETWHGDVTENSSGVRQSYDTDILTLGGGYTFRFNDHFYINPWAAVHIPLSGDKDVRFTNREFKIRATPEASIKIGIHF